MTKEQLYRTAYQWLRVKKEQGREEAEKSAILCADFSELIFKCYREEAEAYKRMVEEEYAYRPPMPIIVNAAIAEIRRLEHRKPVVEVPAAPEGSKGNG